MPLVVARVLELLIGAWEVLVVALEDGHDPALLLAPERVVWRVLLAAVLALAAAGMLFSGGQHGGDVSVDDGDTVTMMFATVV